MNQGKDPRDRRTPRKDPPGSYGTLVRSPPEGPWSPTGRPDARRGHVPCSLTCPTFSSSSDTATCFFFLGLSFQYMTRAALRTARSRSVSEDSCFTSCSFSEVMPGGQEAAEPSSQISALPEVLGKGLPGAALQALSHQAEANI